MNNYFDTKTINIIKTAFDYMISNNEHVYKYDLAYNDDEDGDEIKEKFSCYEVPYKLVIEKSVFKDEIYVRIGNNDVFFVSSRDELIKIISDIDESYLSWLYLKGVEL